MTTPRPRRLFKLPWRTARQIRADVEDELRFHMDMRVEALVAAGASPDAAAAQAMREFGDLNDARQYIRRMDANTEAARRRSDFMGDLRSDIGYAIRKLRAAPAFTLAVVLTLALGIGANTAIFSVVDSVLLRPLPFPNADHLVRFHFTQQGHGDAGTPPDLQDFRSQAKLFDDFALVNGLDASLARAGADPERIAGVSVSASWFSILRVRPLLGRFFARGEDAFGAPKVAVISEQLWRRSFGADRGIIGKIVTINSAPTQIIGVVPAAMKYPVSSDIWMPLQFPPSQLADGMRGARWLGMLARVKDGVSMERASTEVLHISQVMESRFPEQYRERRETIASVHDYTVGSLKKPLIIIMSAVGLVLLIACANVANLMLVRAAARESEFAVRSALGAGRSRLVRQLVTESVMLTLIGAAVGVLLAAVGMRLLMRIAPTDISRVSSASLSGGALALTAAVAVATGIVFGLLPTLSASRGDLATALRAGGRGTRVQASSGRVKRLIVATEVALAITLMAGAGLLLRSFGKLMSVDTGFQPQGVLTAQLELPDGRYDSLTSQRLFQQTLADRLGAIPGVTSVGLTNVMPLSGSDFDLTFTIRGRPVPRPSDEPDAEIRPISPGFFTAMGVPVVSGRGVLPSDKAGTPQVLVVNRAFVKKFFPHDDPLQQQLTLGWSMNGTRMGGQVVGVVGDVRGLDLSQEPAPTIYLPMAQSAAQSIGIVVRSSLPPASLVPSVRGVVRDLDHLVALFDVQTMQDRMAGSVGAQRFYATLVGVFAAVALLLSAVGLYGVIAYAVSQRTHEMGVRVALGATGSSISRMVVAEGLTLTVIGAGVGIVCAFFAARVIASLLYGIDARDPATFIGAVLALCVVAVVASYLPARRAAAVDPLIAMRGD